MTYIETGNKLAAKAIAKALLARLETNKEWSPRECTRIRKDMTADPEMIHRVSSNLHALNDALLKGRSVYAICERQPRGSLDTGHHYFSVYFVNAKGRLERLHLESFTLLLGGTENKRYRDLPYWCFSSGAIGMSRLLSATGGLFNFLKSCGGCYAQLDCL